jgi:tetratricopeptide (TPR) repeat protein
MWQHTAQVAQDTIATAPQNPYGWFNLGVSLTRLAQVNDDAALYENAVVAFEEARAIGIPPRLLFYEQMLLEAYRAAGRFDDLLWLTTILTTSVPAGRYVEEINWYHGEALLASGDTDGARVAFERALRIHAGYAPAQASLAAMTE